MQVRSQFAAKYAKQSVEWMRENLELTNREIGLALGVTSRTVIRWDNLKSSPSSTHREQLGNINVLRHLLSVSFRTEEAMLEWMMTPIPALKGRTPLQSVLKGDLEAVIGLLDTLMSGAFV